MSPHCPHTSLSVSNAEDRNQARSSRHSTSTVHAIPYGEMGGPAAFTRAAHKINPKSVAVTAVTATTYDVGARLGGTCVVLPVELCVGLLVTGVTTTDMLILLGRTLT
jgi:hypothetical protein